MGIAVWCSRGAANATALVQDTPDIRVEVLDTGHLVGAEQPQQANALILEFCG